jgi:hypothetical protein
MPYRVKWLDELRPTEELETGGQSPVGGQSIRRGHPALTATVMEVDNALLGVIKLSTGHAFRNPSHENLEISDAHEQSIHQRFLALECVLSITVMLVLVMGHAGHAGQGSSTQRGRTGSSTQTVHEWEDLTWMLAYITEALVIASTKNVSRSVLSLDLHFPVAHFTFGR